MLLELQIKIIKIAAEIAGMNGNRAGDRISQDWSGDRSALDALTEEEKDLLMEIYEQHNSKGADYEPGCFVDDEMVVSYCIQQSLLAIAREQDSTTLD